MAGETIDGVAASTGAGAAPLQFRECCRALRCAVSDAGERAAAVREATKMSISTVRLPIIPALEPDLVAESTLRRSNVARGTDDTALMS